MAYKIAVVPGDGIGQEITQEAVRVLRAVDAKFALGLTYETRDAGGTAYDKYGTPLPRGHARGLQGIRTACSSARSAERSGTVQSLRFVPSARFWASAKGLDCMRICVQ